MLLPRSCLTPLPITGNATVRRPALPVCAAPLLKTEARRMHWAYTANVCIICDCQQALATLADTRVWVGRCPLAARVGLGQPTMEKVSIFVSPLPPPVAGHRCREPSTGLCVYVYVRHRPWSSLNRNAALCSYISRWLCADTT